uniref:Uncharacterized protein n=1 Tax=Arundo donax TaxID=35708 RepID=A0A0A8YIL9_ARUDO
MSIRGEIDDMDELKNIELVHIKCHIQISYQHRCSKS